MKIERVKNSKTMAFRVTRKDGRRRIYSRYTIRPGLPKLPKLKERE